MNEPSSVPAWFALQVKARQEKQVGLTLLGKDLETFVPVYKSIRKWADRKKEMDLPLFPGYVFCRFPYNRRLPVLVTPGVLRVVGFGNVPTPVDDKEIESLKMINGENAACEPWPYLEIGQKVRIQSGTLCGLEGILLEVRKECRLILSVSLLQRSVAVEVDRDCVEAVSPPPPVSAGVLARPWPHRYGYSS
jgi:transcriptional antiterminator NusG